MKKNISLRYAYLVLVFGIFVPFSVAVLFINNYFTGMITRRLLRESCKTYVFNVEKAVKPLMLTGNYHVANTFAENIIAQSEIEELVIVDRAGNILIPLNKERRFYYDFTDGVQFRLLQNNYECAGPIYNGDEVFGHIYINATYGSISKYMRKSRIALFGIYLGLILIMIVAFIIFNRNIMSPIFSLINHLKEKGTEKISEKKVVFKEFRKLYGQFNSMVDANEAYREELERQSKLAAIGQTTAMLAHDVRKPFSGIRAMLNMFEVFKKSPSEFERAKKNIEKSMQNVETMLGDILDFARDVKLETAPESLVKIIDFSVRLAAQNYGKYNISFTYAIENRLKPLVDDARLARVFSNVICNGIEAIAIMGEKENGRIDIVSRDVVTDAGNLVEVTIGNNGPAFNEGERENLFESFFTKGKKKGTGLGLASAQKIVRLHEGNIEARNRVDSGGVEFVISLPASIEKEDRGEVKLPETLREIDFPPRTEQVPGTNEMIRGLAERGELLKIIIVEDEGLYRASVRNIIEGNETLRRILRLYDAHTVEEALSIISQERITHAIVDIDLGEEQNGFDFLKLIKEKYPEIASIVHSNRFVPEAVERAKKLGTRGFVPKPLKQEHLVMFLAGEILFGQEKKSADSGLKKQTVLYCDDDMLMRMSMRKLIKSIDPTIELHMFERGEELLEKLKEMGSCSVIFTDQHMGPGISGLDLTRKIRETGICCKVYLISNSPAAILEEEAGKAGADGYIEAPVEINEIRAILCQKFLQ